MGGIRGQRAIMMAFMVTLGSAAPPDADVVVHVDDIVAKDDVDRLVGRDIVFDSVEEMDELLILIGVAVKQCAVDESLHGK